MSKHSGVGSVLESLDAQMDLVETSYADFVEGGKRRRDGLVNTITVARTMSWIVQTAKSFDPDFNEWWAEVTVQLFHNEVAAWFVELRNALQKQGTMGSVSSTTSFTTIGEIPPGPPGTVGTFLGDSMGRNGWIVELPDGSNQTVYFGVAPGVESRLMVQGSPSNRSMDDLLAEYVAITRRLVDLTHDRYDSLVG